MKMSTYQQFLVSLKLEYVMVDEIEDRRRIKKGEIRTRAWIRCRSPSIVSI